MESFHAYKTSAYTTAEVAEKKPASLDILHSMKRRGTLRQILLVLLLCIALIYVVVLVVAPWSLHIGGRWTPMLMWQGSGKLLTQGGEYPLYFYFYPGSDFSRLHLDGRSEERRVGKECRSGWSSVDS